MIYRGHSSLEDPRAAAEELAGAIRIEDGLHFVFASPRYDLEKLGGALSDALGAHTIGCTTAGEITPLGYAEGTLAGFSIPRDQVDFGVYLIEEISGGSLGDRIREIGRDADQRIARARHERPKADAFGFLLVDGLSVREELVVGQLHAALRGLPLVGGSAGDALGFSETRVFAEGRFRSDAAIFCHGMTERPFHVFKAQHFEPTENKLVVTKADPEKRLVYRINGRPAAQEYARICSLDPAVLESQTFSRYPVMLKIGGDYYVRSIQRAHADGSLTFFCAIDEGLVLTVARGRRFVEVLEETFREVRAHVPQPELILGCECILRRLEVEDRQIVDEVSRIMAANGVVGFHTYGEQFGAVHVNQTFTGLALG
jgi:hypothetical protein